jgi:galactokinase
VKLFSRWHANIKALRDVSPAQLEQHAEEIPSTVYKRCAHIVLENQRTKEGADALEVGNLKHFGKLMRESHQSLRELYEVSCHELNLMVEAAEGIPGYWGGRMTGGGFGGCTVNLVEAERAGQFAEEISKRYYGKTGINPEIYICSAADGAYAENQ